jgi:3-phenylpropionate/cinnamic acid dioxygenase small subunit
MSATEPYHAICNLLYRYAELIDDGDFDGIAALFAQARIVGPTGVIEGYDGVLAMYTQSTRRYPNGTPCTQHVVTNPIIEVDGNRATARSRFTVLQQTASLPLQVIISGRYHDRFDLVDGHWQFSEREMKPQLYGDLSQHLLFDAKQLQ